MVYHWNTWKVLWILLKYGNGLSRDVTQLVAEYSEAQTGHYYMWPEEYWLLSKYVDLTRGDYLEIGSICGVIAMSFAEKYPQRNFFCVDNFPSGACHYCGRQTGLLAELTRA